MSAKTHDEWSVTTRSVRATQKLAERLGHELKPGTILALVGELGAGKTSFVQGLARGLGIADPSQVVSPSFTLVNEYPGRVPLVHIDFYRLQDADSARALGIDEQLQRVDAVIAVEWADRCPELVPAEAAWIELAWGDGHRRELRVRGIARPARNA